MGVLMKRFVPLFFLLHTAFVFGQLTIVYTVPSSNAKNVPLTTTVSVTFSEAIDTMLVKNYGEDFFFTNIDSMEGGGFSADAKTMFATAVLKPNTAYFFAIFYVKALSGAILSGPALFYFTTGGEFPPHSVSGTVLSGSTGVSPEGAIVGLSLSSLLENENKGAPPFAGWTNVNANGSFSVPNLSNGTYWPIAAKDVDHDGRINPDNGVDVIAFGDSIVVNNVSVTGVSLTFITFQPKAFHDVISIADSMAQKLPANKLLKRISGWDVDTLGRSPSWEFAYTINDNSDGMGMNIGTASSHIFPLDPGYVEWIRILKPIVSLNNIASSAVVIANVENAGGREIRRQHHADTVEFRIELSICSQQYGWFGGQQIDTNKVYWAAAYTHNYQVSQHESRWLDGKMFLCDLQTGAVLLTQSIMDVREPNVAVPAFTLRQNYPNPFNPATTIGFAIRTAGYARLSVYDVLGKEVAVLVDGILPSGDYTVRFAGDRLPSGIYFYQLRSGNGVQTKRMVLIK